MATGEPDGQPARASGGKGKVLAVVAHTVGGSPSLEELKALLSTMALPR